MRGEGREGGRGEACQILKGKRRKVQARGNVDGETGRKRVRVRYCRVEEGRGRERGKWRWGSS